MHRVAALTLIALLVVAPPAPAALDEAGQSAANLLRDAVTPRQDSSHEALLESLRRLGDPTLRPLFEKLALAEQPSLQLHGILGLAETDPAHALPLPVVGELEYAPLQAELIARAMDDDLLDAGAAQQLLGWANLPLPVKLVIATRLLAEGRFDDKALLAEALASDNLGRRSLAALLLLQMGDQRGAPVLSELNASTERSRDAVRAELLRTAVRHEFAAAGPWAYAVATEPEVDGQLELLALAGSMRLGHKPAVARWKQMYQSQSDNAARQRRLALIALRMAPWVAPDTFDLLRSSDDAMIADIGAAGRAIAAGSADAVERIQALLEYRHPMLNNWALAYASHDARPDLAQTTLLGIIVAYEDDRAPDRLERLDDAAQAALVLMEVDPVAGGRLLRPVLTEPATEPLLRQAILLGLLRVDLPQVSDVIDGIQFDDADSRSLALLLRARDGKKLSTREMDGLSLIVRGGSKLQGTLRIQAGWAYLKRTNQIDAAVDYALRVDE